MKSEFINPMYAGNLQIGNLANSEDPDKMQHYAAFYWGLHCLLRFKQSSGKKYNV